MFENRQNLCESVIGQFSPHMSGTMTSTLRLRAKNVFLR